MEILIVYGFVDIFTEFLRLSIFLSYMNSIVLVLNHNGENAPYRYKLRKAIFKITYHKNMENPQNSVNI